MITLTGQVTVRQHKQPSVPCAGVQSAHIHPGGVIVPDACSFFFGEKFCKESVKFHHFYNA